MQKPRKPINWLLFGGLACIFFLAIAAIYFLRSVETAPPPVSTESTPITAPVATASTPVPESKPASDNATLVLELFNPSDAYLTKQLNETAIKQQIEQAQSVSFVLAHCKLIDQVEYADSYRAQIMYALKLKLATDLAAAETLVRKIAESASVSYSLVYSRTRCDSPELPKLRDELLTWQNAILGK